MGSEVICMAKFALDKQPASLHMVGAWAGKWTALIFSSRYLKIFITWSQLFTDADVISPVVAELWGAQILVRVLVQSVDVGGDRGRLLSQGISADYHIISQWTTFKMFTSFLIKLNIYYTYQLQCKIIRLLLDIRVVVSYVIVVSIILYEWKF